MKQRQAPKETPRSLDKLKTAAFRCNEKEHEEFVVKRGSAWMRKTLRAAAKKSGADL